MKKAIKECLKKSAFYVEPKDPNIVYINLDRSTEALGKMLDKPAIDVDLPTEIILEHYGSKVVCSCPDEDDEIHLLIQDGINTGYSMTLAEANDLGLFLINHVKNAENQ